MVHEEIARHVDASDFRVHDLRISDPAVLVVVGIAGSSARGEVAVVAPRDVAAEGLLRGIVRTVILRLGETGSAEMKKRHASAKA